LLAGGYKMLMFQTNWGKIRLFNIKMKNEENERQGNSVRYSPAGACQEQTKHLFGYLIVSFLNIKSNAKNSCL
jgi:hypothetical protein